MPSLTVAGGGIASGLGVAPIGFPACAACGVGWPGPQAVAFQMWSTAGRADGHRVLPRRLPTWWSWSAPGRRRPVCAGP